MAWVRFTRAFDWTPPERRQVTLAYPAGLVANVTRACAGAAKAAGAAVDAPRPKRGDA